MAGDFKFGAKIKLFGKHEIHIRPNPEHPKLVEYHDPIGIEIKKELIVDKLKIEDDRIKNMIPDDTRITDVVYDRSIGQFELGIVVIPGKEFVLNRYDDIIEIQEVSMMYSYMPENIDKEMSEDIDEAMPEEDIDEAMPEDIDEVV